MPATLKRLGLQRITKDVDEDLILGFDFSRRRQIRNGAVIVSIDFFTFDPTTGLLVAPAMIETGATSVSAMVQAGIEGSLHISRALVTLDTNEKLKATGELYIRNQP